MNEKKVLFILHEGGRTGASIYIYKFISHLVAHKECNINIHCAHGGHIYNKIKADNLDVTLITKKCNSRSWLIRIVARVIYYCKFTFMLLRTKPDIVYSNTIINFGQVIISKVLGARTIVHVHEGDNVLSKARLRFKLSAPFTDKYVAVSGYVNSLIRNYTGKNGELVYNGIEITQKPASTRSDKTDIFTIGIIGSIDRNKGQHLVVMALDRLIHTYGITIRLKIIGGVYNADYYNEIMDFIDKHQLNVYVEFTGVLDNVQDIYNKIDAVVVASYDEAFPLVNLEAMLMGKLVIASDTGGNREIIKNGFNGVLFEKGNYSELADKIKWACKETELVNKVIVNAHEVVISKFNLDKAFDKLTNIVNMA